MPCIKALIDFVTVLTEEQNKRQLKYIMANSNQIRFRITFKGEFADKALEREFFNDQISRTLHYTRPLILLFGILYMLFIIPDYLFAPDRFAFYSIFINRSVVFMLLLVLFFALRHSPRVYEHFALWVTACEVLVALSFLIIFVQYKHPNYLIQAFGIMVVICAVYLVPNRWIGMMVASVLISVSFFLFSFFFIKPLPLSDYLAGVVYIAIVLALTGAASYRSNYYNRKQYVFSRELIRLSATDRLTGAYNRAKFDDELAKWVDYANRYQASLSLVFFDIDNFKMVNDTYGHLVGDTVITDIVRIVRHTVRKTDILARWGGDEFILLLPGTGKSRALELAGRLRETVAAHRFEKVGGVTCSFGVASAGKDETVSRIFNRADKSLYAAKTAGKNRVSG